MRRTATAIVMATVLVLGRDVSPAHARRVVRCCVTVADPAGPRPFCFDVAARTRRAARLFCRLIGGTPQRRR
jgi:hypothetical protein